MAEKNINQEHYEVNPDDLGSDQDSEVETFMQSVYKGEQKQKEAFEKMGDFNILQLYNHYNTYGKKDENILNLLLLPEVRRVMKDQGLFDQKITTVKKRPAPAFAAALTGAAGGLKRLSQRASGGRRQSLAVNEVDESKLTD